MDLRNWIRFLIILTALLRPSERLLPQQRTTQGEIEEESKSLDVVNSVLEKGNRLGILEYKGECVGSTLIGSPIQVSGHPEEGADAAIRLKHMLSDDQRFQVSTNSRNVIVIRETGVVDSVLNVRFRRVKLSEDEQFDPNLAVGAILSSKEVAAYLKKTDTIVAPKWGGFRTTPRQGLPKLQQEMKDMTVLEAIEQILVTFPHLAAYKECSNAHGHRIISIEFL